MGLARRRFVFTDALREALREAYRASDRRTLSARLRRVRSLRPSWPERAWRTEAERLGLTRERRRWTEAEDRMLLEMAGRVPAARLAATLGRSAGAVQARAASLQLSLRMREGFTASDLARCFGVSVGKASQWIAHGMFGRVVRDGNALPRVAEGSVRKFIRTHSGEYDLRRVDQVWFCSMAFGGGDRWAA